jgi:hypothetical protein
MGSGSDVSASGSELGAGLLKERNRNAAVFFFFRL